MRKKIQRILALAGVVLLLLLYSSTLVFAMMNRPEADGWFRASLACTIIVPVFLYANILVYRRLSVKDGQESEEKENMKK